MCSEHFLCARFSISSTGARIPIQKGKSPNILRSRTSWRTYLGQRGRVFFSAMCILLCPIPIGQFSTVPGWSSSCESNKTILCDSIISSWDGGTTALLCLRNSHQTHLRLQEGQLLQLSVPKSWLTSVSMLCLEVCFATIGSKTSQHYTGVRSFLP